MSKHKDNSNNISLAKKLFSRKFDKKSILASIWPIYSHELLKFFSIAFLMFCILFVQNVIRATKDSVVNTMIGSEALPFLKFWGVMPAVILYAIIYVKLVNIFKPESLFYIVISSFMAFFGFFGFVLLPKHEMLHMSTEYADYLILHYPNMKWFILIIGNWGFSLFYIISEIWPNAVYSVLFWQFVNGITTVDESKRFYPMFALFGQTGLFFSGSLLMMQSNIGKYLHYEYGIASMPKIASLQFVIFVVVLCGIMSIAAFRYINFRILETRANNLIEFRADKKKKMSIAQSFKFVASSRYILLIAMMLTCYGISINLVEGPWKKMINTVYSSTEDYLAFVGSYLRMTGILTIVFVLLGSNIVRIFGWFPAAIITPIVMFVTGLIFYSTASFGEMIPGMYLWVGYDPIILAIAFGAIQNVITKSTKYTVFDSTKEMAYVPLDNELKVRGKAAADSVGIKLGKSASAFIQSLIFVIFPWATFEMISPYLMVIFVLVCLVWFWAVGALSKEYDTLTRKNKSKQK